MNDSPEVLDYTEDRIRLSRQYNRKKNVYDAAQERIKFVFDNFDRIYLSFSGGKDSGVMLNLFLDYMRRNGITQKIGLMTLDNKANETTDQPACCEMQVRSNLRRIRSSVK